jgi:uncharacterized membrane protein
MEKKIFGIILTIAGAIGLIAAAAYVLNAAGGVRDFKLIGIYGVLGIIFFFSGIGLMRATKDKS